MGRLFLALILGPMVFWLPRVLWTLVRGESETRLEWITQTVILILVTFVGARIMQRRAPEGRAPHYMPVAAAIGLWLLGPVAILVNATILGRGFATEPFDWGMLLYAMLIFPAATFTMSAYDGTLGALVLSTLVLILVATAGAPRP